MHFCGGIWRRGIMVRIKHNKNLGFSCSDRIFLEGGESQRIWLNMSVV